MSTTLRLADHTAADLANLFATLDRVPLAFTFSRSVATLVHQHGLTAAEADKVFDAHRAVACGKHAYAPLAKRVAVAAKAGYLAPATDDTASRAFAAAQDAALAAKRPAIRAALAREARLLDRLAAGCDQVAA